MVGPRGASAIPAARRANALRGAHASTIAALTPRQPLGCKRSLTRARRRPPPFFSYPTRRAGAVFIRCVVASLAHDDAVLDAGRIVDDGRVAQITGNAVFEGAVCKKKRR